jgi:hypothetical protein
MDSLLKPAPKFIPEFIWVSLQRLFLNIWFITQYETRRQKTRSRQTKRQ